MKINNYLLAVISIILASPLNVISQNNRTQETIESAASLVNGVANLFKKKKKTDNVSNKSFEKVVSTYNTISVHPNVKYIECDEMGLFNKGAAVVKKGVSFGLIDSLGNFAVPYGVYIGISMLDDRIGSGFFKALAKDQTGKIIEYIINANGKIVINPEKYPANKTSYHLSDDGKHIVLTDQTFFYGGLNTTAHILDIAGNTTIIKLPKDAYYDLSKCVSDSIFHFWQKRNNNAILTLVNISSQEVFTITDITNIYDFSNGVAVFLKEDPYYKASYGVINKRGEIIIEPTLEFKPGPFKYGFTRLSNTDMWDFDDWDWDFTGEQKVNSKFMNAIIDTTGAIIYKGSTPINKFIGNYSINKLRKYNKRVNGVDNLIDPSYIANRELQTISFPDFFNTIGINPIKIGRYDNAYFLDIDLEDNQIRFSLENSAIQLPNKIGVFDYVNKSVILGDFNFSKSKIKTNPNYRNYLYKDIVSNRIYAIVSSTDKKGKSTLLEGYLNGSGQFVILKKEGAFSGL